MAMDTDMATGPQMAAMIPRSKAINGRLFSGMQLRAAIVVALTLPFLWLSIAASYVNIARGNSGFGTTGWPSNGFSYSAAAEDILRRQTSQNSNLMPSQIDPRIGALARIAFRLEPMDEKAVRQIALLQAQQRGRPLARTTMVLASKLSRRDLIADMWLMEEYGRANNLPKVLEHLDFALRSSGESRSLLISALVKAMANREMIPQMRKLLLTDSVWQNEFWAAVTQGEAPLENVLALRIAVASDDGDVSLDADQRLLRNLVQSRNYLGAFRLYRKVLNRTPSQNISAKVSLGFDRPSLWPPIDWQLSAEGAYSAWLNTEQNELEVSLSGQTDAVFAQRLVELQPGTYRLSGEISMSEPVHAKVLSLSLECAEADPAKAFSTALTFGSDIAAKTVELKNGGCRYFWLNARGTPAGTSIGYNAVFKSVALSRSHE